jgi:FMN-dependent NADH-azoreductase
MTKILHIDTSSTHNGSTSRALSAAIVAKVGGGNAEVTTRDVSQGLPVLTEAQIGAYYTPKADRTEEQKNLLTLSDELVAELKDADIIVLGVPMYNFNVPASLKIYQDLVARVGETFVYKETGPEGLLKGKKTYIAVTTGGVPIGSDYDHLTPSLKTFFGFIGLTDLTFIAADALAANAEESTAKANAEIAALEVA